MYLAQFEVSVESQIQEDAEDAELSCHARQPRNQELVQCLFNFCDPTRMSRFELSSLLEKLEFLGFQLLDFFLVLNLSNQGEKFIAAALRFILSQLLLFLVIFVIIIL